MSTIKIPRNPCATNKKTLKQLRKKIFKYNDTRKKFVKTTSEAKKIVEREADKSVSFIQKLITKKKNKPRVIPMHIVQVWHNKSNLPESVSDSINLIKTHNPDFKHTLFDESECRDFLEKHYPSDVLNAYDKLIPHALKADLWRYCYMYKNGGIYLDAKYYCVNGFKLNLLTDKEYFCRDVLQSFNGIYNAILVCKPNNKIMHKCINAVVKNVENNYYGSEGLCSTGPLMMASFFTKKQVDGLILNHEMLNDNIRFIKYNDCRILQYHEHYKKEKNQKHKHWSKFWESGKMYKK